VTAAAFLERQRIEANDSAAPAVYADGVYNVFRDDALIALSRAVPMPRSTTIAMVAGTSEYPLPADYITLEGDELDADGTLLFRLEDPAGGRFYLGSGFIIRGSKLVLTSAPSANATWTLWYGGTWAITDIPNDWVSVALDYASARAFERRATDAATNFSFTVGPDSINRSSESERWTALRGERYARFLSGLQHVAPESFSTFTFERG
jgi:hypothetical protein